MLLQSKQLTLFYPICFALILRLVLWAPVLLHVVSLRPQVVSVLPWADTKQWAGNLTGLFLLTFYSFQITCFHCKFCPFSFLSGLQGEGKGQNKPVHNEFCALGDFYSSFIWIICFCIIMLFKSKQLTLFHPICFAMIWRLILKAPVLLHVVS